MIDSTSINSIEKWLSRYSLRSKILLLSSMYVLFMTLIGGISAVAMMQGPEKMRATVDKANRRFVATLAVQVALKDMERFQSQTIAEDGAEQLGKLARESIRQAALLEESAQGLAAEEGNPSSAQDLLQLINEIKPARMGIIMAAKKNDDTDALRRAEEVKRKTDAIQQLADSMVSKGIADLDAQLDKAVNHGRDFALILAGLGFVFVVISISLGFAGAGYLSRPLARIETAIQGLASGQLSHGLPAEGRDEIARIARALNVSFENLANIIGQLQQNAESLGGDSDRILNSSASIARAKNTILADVGGMHAAVNDVRTLAENVSSHLDIAVSRADSLEKASSNAAESLERSASDFSVLKSHLDKTLNTTQEFSQSATAIASITKSIAEIAAQTNLLALNAAIEAARAGEHGRGFAVVADEVRKLAQRASEASGQIANLAGSISVSVDTTLSLLQVSAQEANNASENINSIAATSRKNCDSARVMNEFMQQAKTLTAKQSIAVAGISNAASTVESTTTDISHHADELQQISTALATSAESLRNSSRYFSTEKRA